MEPLVVRAGQESLRLRAELHGPKLDPTTLLTIEPRNFGGPNALVEEGTASTELHLRDDGTRGDDVAGDHMFTSAPLVITGSGPGRPAVLNHPVRVERFELRHEGRVSRHVLTHPVTAWVFSITSDVPIPELRVLASGVSVGGHAAALDMPPPKLLPEGFAAGWELDAARRYYEALPDDRDLLLIYELYPRTTPLGAPGAGYGGVRNDVAGIGIPYFDDTPDWGSAGVLRGFIDVLVPPSTANFRTFIHEILHTWCCALDPSLGLATREGHWTANLDRDTTAFLYERFNDLELYLAGFLPADSVRPTIGVDGTTLADLIAIHGPRVPAAADAQRDFRVGLVVVYDRPLTAVELAPFDFLMREFGRRHSRFFDETFESATGGRARLETAIPLPEGLAVTRPARPF